MTVFGHHRKMGLGSFQTVPLNEVCEPTDKRCSIAKQDKESDIVNDIWPYMSAKYWLLSLNRPSIAVMHAKQPFIVRAFCIQG